MLRVSCCEVCHHLFVYRKGKKCPKCFTDIFKNGEIMTQDEFFNGYHLEPIRKRNYTKIEKL